MKAMTEALALLLLAGCQRSSERESNLASDAATTSRNITEPASRTNGTANAELPDDRKPLAEPKGAIDPKSVEAAGQVVQHYGALVEQDRFAEAANDWGDTDAASAFAKQLRAHGLKHLEIGKPAEPEGAAGSIYVTMSVVFYGGSNRSAAEVILRRVNDVPGSTEAERRWHIERIDWKT